MLVTLLLGILGMSTAYADEGGLSIQVFNESGLPAANSSLLLVDQQNQTTTIQTDATGYLYVSLEEGEYTVVLNDLQQSTVKVLANQNSELLFSATQSIESSVPEAQQVIEVDANVPLINVSGIVVDNNGQFVSNATILIRGLNSEFSSDSTGNFSVPLPEGTWDIVVLKEGLTTKRLNNFEVNNATEPVTIELQPKGLEMDDFLITAPRIEGTSATLLAERKLSSSVNDVIGAEQMSRAGDSNAASALKRVTGLTVVGGKYVYVRGLGERYSASLLNGVSLPSPEPERRVVPLDLFPSALLQSITIQKTFSPDKPGEFGGGMVELQTRGIPESRMFRIGLSGSFTSDSTFQQGMMGFQGNSDWTSFGTKPRQLPQNVQNASDNSPIEETDMFSSFGYTATELEQFGESMQNHWALTSQRALPPIGVNLSWGDRFILNNGTLGVLSGVLWNNSWDYENFDRNYFLVGENSSLEKSHTYNFDQLSHDIRVSGVLITQLEHNRGDELYSATLINRSSTASTRTYDGYNRDVATDIRVTRVGWQERSLFFQQLRGNHPLGSDDQFGVKWYYAFAQAGRQEPDRREFRYDLEPGTTDWYLSDRPEGNSIFYSTLSDRNHDGSVQLNRKLLIGNTERESIIRVGAGVINRKRNVDTRRFKYMHKGPQSYDSDVLSKQPEDIFDPDTIGADGFQFEEVTRQTDNYGAGQNIYSSYALVDAKLANRISLLTGMRLESSIQNVQTFELFNPNQTPVLANLEATDILPALTGSLDIGTEKSPDSMKIRAGYGKTVSRPDFRELSPATFNDVTGGRQVFGNPDLQRAKIDNFDLRWEWYPQAGESLSVGGFYKKFHQPIESIVVVSAQHSVTFQNADSAQNLGVEIDFRKNFGFVNPKLEDLVISGNASWIYSRVQLSNNSGIQTSNERALEGQSPYVYNLQFGYDHPDGKGGLTALYNVFGPRITEVGALGAPDYIEEPIHRVDVVSYLNPGDLQIGFKCQNILDWPSRVRTGDVVVEEVLDGRSIGLSINWIPSLKD